MYLTSTQRMLLLSAISALMIAGCATPPEYSAAENPFNALTPKANRAFATVKLCLLLSGNTSKSVAYLNELSAKMGRLGNDTSDYDPKRRVADLTGVLNARFGEVVVVNELAEAQRQQCTASLALDIRVQAGSMSFTTTTVEMAGVLADGQGKEIESVAGIGKGTVPYPATSLGVAAAWDRAAAAMAARIDQSEAMINVAAGIRPVAVVAAAPVAVAPQPRTSVKVETPSRPVAISPPSDQRQPMGALVFAPRKALVIGNDNYRNVTKLNNAVYDAQAISNSLKQVGYQVFSHYNLDEKGFKQALRDFRLNVEGGDEVVFFFAGHGVQIGAANYLLPVDIHGGSEDQVKDEAIQLQRILDDLQEKRAKFSLAIVDACRDNPFKGSGRAIGGRGLAPTTAATGQMIMFSAGTGQQALDKLGDQDPQRNGVFTRVLIKEMTKPGVTVDRVLRNVRNEVVGMARSVGHEQTPALYDQAVGDFYFKR